MNNKTLKRGFLIPLLSLLLLFNSCDLLNKDAKTELSIVGTWLDSQYGGKIVITDSEYTNYWSNSGVLTLGWKGQITSFGNNVLNAGDTETTPGAYGYFVVKYDPIDGGSGKGKYGVVRWNALKTESDITTMSCSEGYNAVGYFDSEAEAIAGMTSATNYFNYYTTMTKE